MNIALLYCIYLLLSNAFAYDLCFKLAIILPYSMCLGD